MSDALKALRIPAQGNALGTAQQADHALKAPRIGIHRTVGVPRVGLCGGRCLRLSRKLGSAHGGVGVSSWGAAPGWYAGRRWRRRPEEPQYGDVSEAGPLLQEVSKLLDAYSRSILTPDS